MLIDLKETELSIGEECMVTKAFMEAIRLKGESLYQHSIITGELAGAIWENLGYDSNRTDLIKKAGYLHDLGKISIKESVLLKPGTLNDQEWEQMRLHPILGSIAIEGIPGFEEISKIILYHHERYDGTGYPNGFGGNEIPIESVVIRLCDMFTAMTNERTYKPCYPTSYVLKLCLQEVKHYFNEHELKLIYKTLQKVCVKSNGKGNGNGFHSYDYRNY